MPRNVTEPSFQFWFEEKWYTQQGAETMARIGTKDDYSTMRSEYTRMRDVAQKRIKRLAKEFPESKAYQAHAKGFPKLREMDPRDFPTAFAELAKFVKAKTSTVTGQRRAQEKTMRTLNQAIGAVDEETGEVIQTPVTQKNYWRVIQILNEARKQKATYGSDKIVSLAETTMSLSQDQFDDLLNKLSTYVNHYDEVKPKMDEYMKKQKIKQYQQVDMDDFLQDTGWLEPVPEKPKKSRKSRK